MLDAATSPAGISPLENNTARASHPRLVAAATTAEMPRGPGRSAESLRPLWPGRVYSSARSYANFSVPNATHSSLLRTGNRRPGVGHLQFVMGDLRSATGCARQRPQPVDHSEIDAPVQPGLKSPHAIRWTRPAWGQMAMNESPVVYQGRVLLIITDLQIPNVAGDEFQSTNQQLFNRNWAAHL